MSQIDGGVALKTTAENQEHTYKVMEMTNGGNDFEDYRPVTAYDSKKLIFLAY